MTCYELATIAEYNIPVKVVILNNDFQGMIKQWQDLFYDRRYSARPTWATSPTSSSSPRPTADTGLRLTEKATLLDDMKAALALDGLVVDRRPRHPGGERLPDDRAGSRRARRRASHGRTGNQGAAEPRGPGGIGRDALRAQAHAVDPRGEEARACSTRIAGLFARRGFNIDTLSVGPTDEGRISRITLMLDGAVHPIDQVTKQLHKLINVLKIRDLEPVDTVARELALFKVAVDGVQRAEVMQICEIFRGKVVDVTKRSLTIEVTGTTDKIEAFERMVRPFGLVEMMRTGEIAIARGRGEN